LQGLSNEYLVCTEGRHDQTMKVCRTVQHLPSSFLAMWNRFTAQIRYDTICYLHWKTDRQAASL